MDTELRRPFLILRNSINLPVLKDLEKKLSAESCLGTFVLSTGYYDAYFTKAQQVRQLLVQKTKGFLVTTILF